MSIPWVEKYRPGALGDVISHQHITATLRNLIKTRCFPHVIFYGPSGTGKTTTILACAREIYGDEVTSMVLELNGSDDRGINVVREQIKEFSSTNNMLQQSSRLKLVILDEADSMTYDAQFALRQMIENYTSNTRFCFVCNYITKIIPGIQSRCITFKFSPISDESHYGHLVAIAQKENINISGPCLQEIIKISEGDMRRSINVLQALYMNYAHNPDKNIDVGDMYQTIGHPSPSVKTAIVNAVFDNNISDAYIKVNELKHTYNLCVNDILKEMTEHMLGVEVSCVKLARILEVFAKIETYLSNNVNEDIQLGAIISAVKINLL